VAGSYDQKKTIFGGRHAEQRGQSQYRHEDFDAQRVFWSQPVVEPTANEAAEHRKDGENDPGNEQIERFPLHHAGGEHTEEKTARHSCRRRKTSARAGRSPHRDSDGRF
jgi:hypothetical protein